MAGPEKIFENKVKKYLSEQGAWYVKFFANKMTKEGIPDILVCLNGFFIGLEIKSQNGKPSDLQIYHCRKIRESKGLSFVLYPSGFDQFKRIVAFLHDNMVSEDWPIILK